MHKRERHVKLFGTILCEVFAFLTIIYLLADGEADRLALAFGTLLLALLPMLLENLLRCRICLPVYLFALAYPLCTCGNRWVLFLQADFPMATKAG